MPDTVTAISLPTEERATIAALFTAAGEDFDAWQRDTLAAKVQALRLQLASAEAQAILTAAASEIQSALPTLFEQPEQPEAAPEL